VVATQGSLATAPWSYLQLKALLLLYLHKLATSTHRTVLYQMQQLKASQ
jgi:hypothetical protein